jgi:D-alanyl-D-alanine carboxypeptidase
MIFTLLIASTCTTAGQGPAVGVARERAGTAQSDSARTAIAVSIDSLAAAVVDRGEAVGLTVAVLQREEAILVRGYGVADLESRAAATDSSRFYIGSITKVVTAAAVLRLAANDQLGLDDDIRRHVPELDSPGPSITLRHLLNHTSGLVGPQQVAGKFLERRHLEFSREQLVELLQGEPRVSAPGERFAYNNLGYLLLGIVLERVSGQSYEDHLHAGVLAPGAASIMLCDQQRVIPHRASGYEVRNGTVVNHEPVNASLLFAAGGLCAAAGDVARWFRSLTHGEIIPPSAFLLMSTPDANATGTNLSYGYGLFVDEVATHRRVHHGGDANGFSAHAAHYPDHDVTVVVLSNTRGPAARGLEQQIARRMLDIR